MDDNDVPGKVELNECPPGLFTYNGTLCFKSEYTTVLKNPLRYQCDAYVVSSGEYFHGGEVNSLARGKLKVTPCYGGIEQAVSHLMNTRRIGTASINDHQRDADNKKMREAYKDILEKALPFILMDMGNRDKG